MSLVENYEQKNMVLAQNELKFKQTIQKLEHQLQQHHSKQQHFHEQIEQ